MLMINSKRLKTINNLIILDGEKLTSGTFPGEPTDSLSSLGSDRYWTPHKYNQNPRKLSGQALLIVSCGFWIG
jgi:hypothetical protein